MSRAEGRAIVYCEGAFRTPNGKTAHGLVRRTRRYEVLAVVDSTCAGDDAARALDGTPGGIPLLASVGEAVEHAALRGKPATHLVIGLAPDGGRLELTHRNAVRQALEAGLDVDSGLHDFLSDDPEFQAVAAARGRRIRDVRKPPPRDQLHFYSGKIREVEALKIAILGTDSAVGKRTTAWILVDALEAKGAPTELVGTGQTAWMQGARYGVVLDALVNDFVSGEIEHAVWSAWNEQRPRAIVIEGQGSLMNPAYPGGFEILAAGRPDAVVLQHAPARVDYDGFPGHRIEPLPHQIQAIEIVSGRPVVAVTVCHENLAAQDVPAACRAITRETGLPAWDVLLDSAMPLAELVLARARR